MRSLRWCAGLAAAAGLVGSLMAGPSASAAPGAVRTVAASRAVRAAVPAAAAQEEADRRTGLRPGTDPNRLCLGLVPPPYTYALRSQYLCGDWRLGPKRLPRGASLLGSIIDGYRRLGNLTPVEFLNRYWLPNKDDKRGDWDYPPDDGFALNSRERPIIAPVVLHVGQRVDRFGPESGRFLSPAGAKLSERAIPPSNLDTTDPRYPFDYHLYTVKQQFTVDGGPVAPWFEQPGQGVQYRTSDAYFPNLPAGEHVNVKYLVTHGYLVRAN